MIIDDGIWDDSILLRSPRGSATIHQNIGVVAVVLMIIGIDIVDGAITGSCIYTGATTPIIINANCIEFINNRSILTATSSIYEWKKETHIHSKFYENIWYYVYYLILTLLHFWLNPIFSVWLRRIPALFAAMF